MKTLKKALALLLSMTMVLAMGLTAFADNGGYTLTIKDTDENYVYTAYQVFDASVDSEGKLGDVTWGSAVDGDTILAKLQADDALKIGDTNAFASCTTAADVAAVLKEQTNDSAFMVEVADVIGHNLKAGATGTVATYVAASGDTAAHYVAENLDGGYYIVVNSAPKGETLSRYLLQVVKSTEIAPKKPGVEIDKDIVSTGKNAPLDGTDNKVDTAAIGDVLNYQISSKVPTWTGYSYYYYVINDTLSTGLTLDADSIVVKVGDTTLTKDSDYKVYTGEDAAPYTFRIAFTNIKGYAIGTAITVDYNATVNENAVIGLDPNTNKVDLTYSNNPNDSEQKDKDGKPGIPDESVPTGKLPEVKTETYVTELKLTKIDGETQAALQGAEFTLIGKNLTQIKFTTGTSYVAADDGTYYKLKDGTYTNEAPQPEVKDDAGNVTTKSNEDKYESITQKYKLQTVATSVAEGTDSKKVVAYVGEDGTITFTGLNAGTYTLKETHTPDGYNTAADITFTISSSVTKDETTEEGTFAWSVDQGVTYDKGTFKVTVENLKGSTLPSTGGMGTTIFYVVGTILVLGAAVVLITRKRMGGKA